MSTNILVLQHNARLRRTFVQRHALLFFFSLLFGLTWPFMIVDALGSHALLPFRLPIPLLLIMSYMPTAAALIVTGLTVGREGVRTLLRKALVWRMSIGWYVVAILGFGGICFSAIILHNLFGDSPNMPLLSKEAVSSSSWGLVLNVLLLFVMTTLINGEEFAWRGFALPRLQARWNASVSSLILGAIWALFHLPLFFTLTGSSQAGASMSSFLLSTLGLSIIFTWLYNSTGDSVLLAYLLHGAVNTWPRVFSIDHGGPLVGWFMTGLICLVAILLLITFGPRELARNRRRIQYGEVLE